MKTLFRYMNGTVGPPAQVSKTRRKVYVNPDKKKYNKTQQ